MSLPYSSIITLFCWFVLPVLIAYHEHVVCWVTNARDVSDIENSARRLSVRVVASVVITLDHCLWW